MNVTKLECPNCHAALDNDYENAGTFFCKYCGQKMIVEEIQNAEYDLKVRKMEMDHEGTDTYKQMESGSDFVVGIGGRTYFNINERLDLERILFLIKLIEMVNTFLQVIISQKKTIITGKVA